MFPLASVSGLSIAGQESISGSEVESYLPCKSPGKLSVDLDTYFENAKGRFLPSLHNANQHNMYK